MYRNTILAACLTTALSVTVPASNSAAQSSPASRTLNLAPDSPFRDPDIIYLEADELISNEENRTLIAVGEVEGRYQDRTIRAERVTYFLDEGRVIATGNVTLVNADGSSQFAQEIELSDELETGAAYNFTSRLPNGGITGAAFAQQHEGGIDLYNAYYTACEPCEDKKNKNPSWQIKAKRVSQDTDKNVILYKDAVFELFGLPVLYTPYLAHPDLTQDRATGWLNPFGGFSQARGAFLELPYYIAVDDYTELTLTPHIFTNVNPLLEVDFRRKFHTGEVNLNGSLTYASTFDRNGDPFSEDFTFLERVNGQLGPSENAPTGRRLRAHVFADGEFRLADNWDWGFTAQLTPDDLFTRRYNLDQPRQAGLYNGGSRRLISQLFGVGQSDNFRFTAGVYGFESIRTTITESATIENQFTITREDDDELPIIAPKIEASYFVNDPLIGGRLEAFGDFTMLTREQGTDYTRGTAGLSWSKSLIAPGGIEAKPFGEFRYDNFSLTPFDDANGADLDEVNFDRSLGQVGVDIRWPFINSTGKVDFVVEPRALITESFGNGQVSNFRADLDNDGDLDFDLLQDSIDIDFDHNLIWSPNKSTGFDLWQEGFRADVGGSLSALWNDNHATLFVGQSFTDRADDIFDIESGLSATEILIDPVSGDPLTDPLSGDILRQSVSRSDIVGQFELALSDNFLFDTRLRYDDDDNAFRRLDTGFRYNSKLFDARVRYYKIDQATLLSEDDAPAEEINGFIGVNLTDNWRLSYSASRDLDQDVTRRQRFGVAYQDHCTLIELFYNRFDFQNDAVRGSDNFGIRVSLLSLGQFGGDNRQERF